MANYGIQFKDNNGNKYYPCPFPVGFVVLTTSKVNPSTYWGGTWVQMHGGYLYACQNTAGQTSYTGWGTQSKASFTSGSTTLTVDQIPAHTHALEVYGGAAQWAVGHLWGRSGAENDSVQSAARATKSTGGGKGHTHPIPAHSHNIASIDVFAWKRTA